MVGAMHTDWLGPVPRGGGGPHHL
eukprot:SAG25_NODE_8214_length_433_cov_0.622754_1_plen_23_part_10